MHWISHLMRRYKYIRFHPWREKLGMYYGATQICLVRIAAWRSTVYPVINPPIYHLSILCLPIIYLPIYLTLTDCASIAKSATCSFLEQKAQLVLPCRCLEDALAASWRRGQFPRWPRRCQRPVQSEFGRKIHVRTLFHCSRWPDIFLVLCVGLSIDHCLCKPPFVYKGIRILCEVGRWHVLSSLHSSDRRRIGFVEVFIEISTGICGEQGQN